MRIGVPKEIKDQENRVGVTPEGTRQLTVAGHEVLVERGAGAGCGFADAEYAAAGAITGDAAAAWNRDLVIKVKEPLEREYRNFAGQVLFTYLHLAGAPRALTEALLATRTTAVAYETIEDESGRFPLLAPMSAVAGSMAPLMGAYYLAKVNGGRGTLLGNLFGERHGNVAIVGDGVVGRHACNAASALGARVTVFGITPERAAEFETPGSGVRYTASTPANLAAALPDTDLLIGAVLRPGARAPHVVTEAMVKSMPAGAVIVDVSIDQGGCVATSRPTSHSDPVFIAHGVLHYCVSNMPAAYPRTSTLALTAATLPYVLELAAGGTAALGSPKLAAGVHAYGGYVTNRAVADALEQPGLYRDFAALAAAP
jgi:alanine dehydrogenase